MSRAAAARLDPAFAPNYAQQHGCAWFSLPEQGVRDPAKVGGWAAVGGEPAFPFNSWRDLPAETVWWTNLRQHEAWTLAQWSRFKEGGMLGVPWLTLMNEWGQATDETAAPEAVRRGSELLARMGFWLSGWAAQASPDQPWGWGQGDLADALGQRVGWGNAPLAELQPVFQAAYTASIGQDLPASFWVGRRRVGLTLPRLNHVRRLWQTPYPEGPWALVPADAWPERLALRVDWALTQSVPLLLRVDDLTWLPGGEEEGWLWLGTRGRPFAGAEREPVWMTGEEMRQLSQWATLQLGAACQGTSWTTEPPLAGWDLGADDPIAVHAPMPGLLGWAAFQAAASPTRDPTRRHKHQITPRALWWRAAERQRCFEAARRLQKRGLAVAEYGNGQAVIVLDGLAPPAELAAIVRDAGFVVPPLLAKDLARAPMATVDDPVALAHWLRSSADPELLCDLDRLVAPWPGPLEQVKGVLSQAAQRLLALVVQDSNLDWKAQWKDMLNQQARISVDRVKRQARAGA